MKFLSTFSIFHFTQARYFLFSANSAVGSHLQFKVWNQALILSTFIWFHSSDCFHQTQLEGFLYSVLRIIRLMLKCFLLLFLAWIACNVQEFFYHCVFVRLLAFGILFELLNATNGLKPYWNDVNEWYLGPIEELVATKPCKIGHEWAKTSRDTLCNKSQASEFEEAYRSP